MTHGLYPELSSPIVLPQWLGFKAPPVLTANVLNLGSMRTMLAMFLNVDVVSSVFVGFAFLFYLLLLYIILRKQWLAVIGIFITALLVEISAFASSGPSFFWIASILISLIIVTAVARLGLLATMTAQLFFFMTALYPMTTDFSACYASATVFGSLIVIGLATYGFYTSLGGQPLFSEKLLREEPQS